jgi:hypothetical protein
MVKPYDKRKLYNKPTKDGQVLVWIKHAKELHARVESLVDVLVKTLNKGDQY